MSQKPSMTAKVFLENIKHDQSQTTLESLERLLEELENKVDPDPVEVRLVESIYSFIEKYKLLENNISTYVKEYTKKTVGNKLSDLYESNNKIGTSVLFD